MRMTLPISLAALALLTAAAPLPGPAYHVAESIAVPDGSWDYARVDPDAHRLYVARAGFVTVVDLAAANAVSTMGTIERGHAVVPLPGGKLLVTSGNDATVRFLDSASGRELARVAVGKKPDAAIYDAASGLAYVMNATDGSVSILDVAAMRVVDTIQLKPGLEYAALGKDGALYVNDEDTNEIEVADLKHGGTASAIALPGCEEPSGLAYDAKQNVLISACANGKAAIVDIAQRKMTGLVDIGVGPDAVILDAERRLAFIPCGKDGVLDILSLDAPGGVKRVARVKTAFGARTGALDPTTGAIYLPSSKFSPPTTPGGRPMAIPGTAHILVVRFS